MGFITQILTYKFLPSGKLRLWMSPTTLRHWKMTLSSESVLQSKYRATWVWCDILGAEKVIFASCDKTLFAFSRYKKWRLWKDAIVEGIFHLILVIFYFSKLQDNIWAWLLVQQQILKMYLFFRTQLFELQYCYYSDCPESCWEAKQTELLMKINSCLIETFYLKSHIIKKMFKRETGHKCCRCSSEKYFVLFGKGRKRCGLWW